MKSQQTSDAEGSGSVRKSEYGSKLGISEWFHKDDYKHVENTIENSRKVGIKELRTVFSWADFHTPGGREWYDWLIPKLAKSFHVLPCVYCTPPSLGLENLTSSPPKNPKMFADFIDIVINRYGSNFEYIELWNEPNNISSYNYRLDPSWDKFNEMIVMSSHWARRLGKKTILGGLNPIDASWLETRAKTGILENIDVVGVHGFPETFDISWNGWDTEINKIKSVLDEHESKAEIWITETGYSSWKHDDQNQISRFLDAIKSPVKKIYWNSLYDLSPLKPAPDGFHQDERKYHFGMIQHNGLPKLLYRMLCEFRPEEIEKEQLFLKIFTLKSQRKKGVLITGGAGFIGTNLASRLLQEGHRVIIYDNLSRPGVENNLKWLLSDYPDLEVMIADVNDFYSLRRAINEAEQVFHFAAQVAVTSSLDIPLHDYEVNVGGTINVLEAIRQSAHKPSLIYTSTNKVYGDLSGLELKSDDKRYYPIDFHYFQNGINEKYPLSFHSPYGSSKGSADQYILDYSRSFGLRNVVFRMSCIYGPHQFGTEDQGWIAHFLNQSIKEKGIKIYGDGKQVRDILYVDDLVNAFMLAWKNIDQIAGQPFNIGGGPDNSISLIELLSLMHKLDHLNIQVTHDKWRTGDQKYYVSDTRKFNNMTGWVPKVSYAEGIKKIFNWLYQYNHPETQKAIVLK